MSKVSDQARELELDDKYRMDELKNRIYESPDSYVGLSKPLRASMFIHHDDHDDNDAVLIYETFKFIPALYKICDEIMVNAADRTIESDCNVIKINVTEKSVSVWNNGESIDIVFSRKYQKWYPVLMFTETLTSTHYDKSVKRMAGGKNGIGAKAANIFSHEFNYDSVDEKTQRRITFKCEKNMSIVHDPIVKEKCKTKSFTHIHFYPDFERFELEQFDANMLAVLHKRAIDLAMTCKAKVYFNDELIKIDTFTKYVNACFDKTFTQPKFFDIVENPRWQVCVIYDPAKTIPVRQISFVNSVFTIRNGSHVDHVMKNIAAHIIKVVQARKPNTKINPATIKDKFVFFVNASIEDPTFDSQSKDMLGDKVSDFGSRYTPDEKFIRKLTTRDMIDDYLSTEEDKLCAKKDRTPKINPSNLYPKLYDASEAHLRRGDCTLILTEGDSPRATAMAGIAVVGREKYGIFPLKGKFINVRKATRPKIKANKELKAIMDIMGLEEGKEYTSTKGLRYGRLLILTDQDVDGFHIKGLVMSCFHFLWPSLVMHEKEFLRSFLTPIVTVTKGKQKLEFYNVPSYEDWCKKHGSEKGWTPKYFKGLGTSGTKEAQQYFSRMHEITVTYLCQDDRQMEMNEQCAYKPRYKNRTDDAFDLAFGNDKERANDRKLWIGDHDSSNYFDGSEKVVYIHDFVNQELILHSVANNIRSMINIVDGFKVTQRKAFAGAVKHGLYKHELGVNPLIGYITEQMVYHHGPASLYTAITGMGYNFVGANNLPIFNIGGQLGTRLQGGKDSAADRYLTARLNPIMKYIFVNEDTPILPAQFEQKQPKEPEFFLPIIPMGLVNGTDGIGTGYASHIEMHNPAVLSKWIRCKLTHVKCPRIMPWFRHFLGQVYITDNGNYITCAPYTIDEAKDTVTITDLPVGTWTDVYKAYLNKAVLETKGIVLPKKKNETKNQDFFKQKNEKSKATNIAKNNFYARHLASYTDDCTDMRIYFVLQFEKGTLQNVDTDKLEQDLKLIGTHSLNNMNVYDENGQLIKVNTYEEIMSKFIHARLPYYDVRKDYWLNKYQQDSFMLKWKVKFMRAVLNDTIVVFKRTTKQLIARLEELEYPRIVTIGESATYDYLTSIHIGSFTQDKIEELLKQLQHFKDLYNTLKPKTNIDLWLEDLQRFDEAYVLWEAEEQSEYDTNYIGMGKTAAQTKKPIRRRPVARKALASQ